MSFSLCLDDRPTEELAEAVQINLPQEQSLSR